MGLTDNPKLSVVVTSYNNGAFIERCLNSILSQKANFKFEVLVGDDNSSDQSRKIIDDFHRRFPESVFPVFRESNLGTSANFIDLVYRAKGDFIAQVDADDVLIDSSKFQIQSDFLDNNLNCSICFHHFVNLDSDGNELPLSPKPFNENTVVGLDFLLTGNMGPGNTTMFRKSAIPAVAPKWLIECGNHKDFALQFMIACKGKIGYIDKLLSGYTHHPNNITKTESKETLFLNSVIINENLYRYQKELQLFQHLDTFKWIINHKKLRLAFHFLERGAIIKFFKVFFPAILDFKHWNSAMIKDSIYHGAPNLANRIKRKS